MTILIVWWPHKQIWKLRSSAGPKCIGTSLSSPSMIIVFTQTPDPLQSVKASWKPLLFVWRKFCYLNFLKCILKEIYQKSQTSHSYWSVLNGRVDRKKGTKPKLAACGISDVVASAFSFNLLHIWSEFLLTVTFSILTHTQGPTQRHWVPHKTYGPPFHTRPHFQ